MGSKRAVKRIALLHWLGKGLKDCGVRQKGGNASLIGIEGSNTGELVSGKLKV